MENIQDSLNRHHSLEGHHLAPVIIEISRPDHSHQKVINALPVVGKVEGTDTGPLLLSILLGIREVMNVVGDRLDTTGAHERSPVDAILLLIDFTT